MPSIGSFPFICDKKDDAGFVEVFILFPKVKLSLDFLYPLQRTSKERRAAATSTHNTLPRTSLDLELDWLEIIVFPYTPWRHDTNTANTNDIRVKFENHTTSFSVALAACARIDSSFRDLQMHMLRFAKNVTESHLFGGTR